MPRKPRTPNLRKLTADEISTLLTAKNMLFAIADDDCTGDAIAAALGIHDVLRWLRSVRDDMREAFETAIADDDCDPNAARIRNAMVRQNLRTSPLIESEG